MTTSRLTLLARISTTLCWFSVSVQVFSAIRALFVGTYFTAGMESAAAALVSGAFVALQHYKSKFDIEMVTIQAASDGNIAEAKRAQLNLEMAQMAHQSMVDAINRGDVFFDGRRRSGEPTH